MSILYTVVDCVSDHVSVTSYYKRSKPINLDIQMKGIRNIHIISS